MLTYEPVKVLFQVGPVKLFSWGLLNALAFVVVAHLVLKEAEKKVNKDRIVNFAIFSLIGGLIGARLFYVFLDLDFYLSNPLKIFSLWDGGTVSYGVIIIGLLAGFLYLKAKKESIMKFLDLIAPYLALGWAIGRIGCFLNWCCYGIKSSLPWALSVGGDVARHPTQIYSSIANLIIFAILMKIRHKKFFAKTIGSMFFMWLSLYSAWRLLVQPIRQVTVQGNDYVTYAMYGVGLVVSVLFLVLKKKKYKSKIILHGKKGVQK